MGIVAQRRKAEKALRERWEFWFGYGCIVLAFFGTGYLFADHRHEYLASIMYLGAVATLASGMWFLRWSRSTRWLVTFVLFVGFAVFDAKWLYDLPPEIGAPVLAGWGAYTTGCIALVDTSQILNLQDTHRIYLSCQLVDPTMDPLEDTRITISNPFRIVKDTFKIIVNYDPHSPMATLSRPANPPNQAHMSLFILPNDVDISKVRKLSDVPKLGGILWPTRDAASAITP